MELLAATGASAPPSPRQRRREAAQRVDQLAKELSDAVGVSVRRVFRRQALSAQSSIADVRRHLPELAQFLDAARARRRLHAARKAFCASRAAWLSRSARQSGVSALLARQLVHLATAAAARGDGSAPPLVRFAARVLLDALLAPCAASRACEWRQRRPAYHAMGCALVWHALLPSMASLALRWPAQVAQVLDAHYDRPRPQQMRANCVFAHVSGVWALIERLHAGIADADAAAAAAAPAGPAPAAVDAPGVVSLMQRLVEFLVRVELLGAPPASDADLAADAEAASKPPPSPGAPDFSDLLLDKFFVELQGFLFSCPRAHEVVGPALQSALARALVGATRARLEPRGGFLSKLSVLAGLASVLVQPQADAVVSTLLRECRARCEAPSDSPGQHGRLLGLAVGFSAHVDLVGLRSVLDVLVYLVDALRDERAARRADCAAMLVYVAFHRRAALAALRDGAKSTTWRRQAREHLLLFRDRICSQVDPLAFCALPAAWMAVFWTDWLGLAPRDVGAFHALCREADAADAPAHAAGERPGDWTRAVDALPFRAWSRALAVSSAHVRPHWVPPDAPDEREPPKRSATLALAPAGSAASATKRRRRRREGEEEEEEEASEQAAATALDPEADERRRDALLLPDVLERVCSFLSAKRLRRLAAVSRAFAEVSRRAALWRALWRQLAAKEPQPPVCRHGPRFEHDWRAMYWSRAAARRRLRRARARLARLRGADAAAGAGDGGAAREPAPQICAHCGCHALLASAALAAAHAAAHERHGCQQPGCGASFSSALKLRRHGREAHLGSAERPGAKAAATAKPRPSRARGDGEPGAQPAKPRVRCGFPGCRKTYVSLKRLETHRKQLGHVAQA